jgi:ketosteroid isomerase-like protein
MTRSTPPARRALLRLLPFLGLLAFLASSARAAGDRDFEAVRRADAARIQATISRDIPPLAALLSDDLTYGFSDGRVQSKAQLLTSVATSRVHFTACDYLDNHLLELTPGVISMTGRAQIRADAEGGPTEFRLRFLAVWRREDDGRWRLIAYQSAPLADASP